MLKAKYESEDEIPEALKEFYAPEDDKEDGPWWLQIEDRELETLPKVRGLATANKENRKKRDEYRRKAEQYDELKALLPDDVDPATIKDLIAGANSGDKEIKAQFEARIDKLKRDHQAALENVQGELGQTRAQLDDVARRRALRKALRDNGVDPKHDAILLDHLGSKVKVTADPETGERTTEVDTALGTVDVNEFVKDWVKADGKPYLEDAKGPGGNPGGGRIPANMGAKNPFLKANWNKTQQAKLPLERRDALARAAGFKDFAAGMEATSART
ncbi:hypothetical protein [Roseinatronobacter alkalisoli]|uniref:Phage protein n=1 Tax=Roseinatronobacter alkalisoli TaxID=3028235 RepID=A0ABT5TEA0_9RHOB|nr:hypothetical protein [Roseinatronobacter sp. HJB301]MDD7973437.1 hypothetical protein [Roseinatronobacter sp. HJB301]